MKAWFVRAGRNGENEALALDEEIAVIGWSELGDLSGIETKEALKNLIVAKHPELSTAQIGQAVAQVWAFCHDIVIGDIIALPLKTRGVIALGTCSGPYLYRPELTDQDAVHTRAVDWKARDLSRTRFDEDLLLSLNSGRTVGQIQRENAVPRLRALMVGDSVQLTEAEIAEANVVASSISDLTDVPPDIERTARDQIASLIGRRFRTYSLESLIRSILEARGYFVHQTRPGKDGGADLLAGRGELGFESPFLCVQVKSSSEAVGTETLQLLQAAVDDFGASHGLLVSWGGFRESLYNKRREKFFHIRLWDSDDIVAALLDIYDKLPEDIRAELPLKRVWIVASS
ncbi:MAG TPA: restriction endonuclease [Candidatus Elarobacter sp.]|nr:restriction endonuclease [Candidatus Elarobacter sp.]